MVVVKEIDANDTNGDDINFCKLAGRAGLGVCISLMEYEVDLIENTMPRISIMK